MADLPVEGGFDEVEVVVPIGYFADDPVPFIEGLFCMDDDQFFGP